jgi:Ca2+/Na+ antiporter
MENMNSVSMNQVENKNIDNNTKIPFWVYNPNILLDSRYINEFFPIETMLYEQKLNAISRTVIFLTIIVFLFTHSFRILVISGITLFSIYMLYQYNEKETQKKTKETFENQSNVILDRYNFTEKDKAEVFQEPQPENPFGNVLIPEYEYNPNRKPAPPSFNDNVNDTILKQAKKMVSELNPDQPDISDKLFTDLGDNLIFEQSLRQFVSNPSTTIPNDQTGFAEFCYGSMISSKDGNLFALARNLPRYNNY